MEVIRLVSWRIFRSLSINEQPINNKPTVRALGGTCQFLQTSIAFTFWKLIVHGQPVMKIITYHLFVDFLTRFYLVF